MCSSPVSRSEQLPKSTRLTMLGFICTFLVLSIMFNLPASLALLKDFTLAMIMILRDRGYGLAYLISTRGHRTTRRPMLDSPAVFPSPSSSVSKPPLVVGAPRYNTSWGTLATPSRSEDTKPGLNTGSTELPLRSTQTIRLTDNTWRPTPSQ
jgi:hypothetical protein